MRALVWHGKSDVRCDTVPDPTIEDAGDMIVKITSTAICGSDLHLYDGYMPMMEEGDILGHEPMGIVAEVGSSVTKFKVGDRVVVPFTIACGTCFFCEKELYSCCDTTNRDRGEGGEDDGSCAGGALRLLAPDRRLSRAARRNTCACLMPTSSPLKIENDSSRTSRCCFSPTFSRPATWRRRTPRSSRATPSRSGVADRSGSSRSRAPGCSAPVA